MFKKHIRQKLARLIGLSAILLATSAAGQAQTQGPDCSNIVTANNNAIQNAQAAIDTFVPYQNVAQNQSLMQQCMSATSGLNVGNVQAAGYSGIGAFLSRAINSLQSGVCNTAMNQFNSMQGQISQQVNSAVTGATGSVTSQISKATGGTISSSSLLPDTTGMINNAAAGVLNGGGSYSSITNQPQATVPAPGSALQATPSTLGNISNMLNNAYNSLMPTPATSVVKP